MKAVSTKHALTALCVAATILVPGCASVQASGPGAEPTPPTTSGGSPASVRTSANPSGGGQVTVQGKGLLRDGHPWIPHGFYQIAFEVAPGDFSKADHSFWATAYHHYTPDEYRSMREAGADSVRLQIAQVGADPHSALFDKAFLDKARGAVRAARQAGLTVIVSIQDEIHVPNDKPIDLPDDGTQRAWQEIAPQFANDQGVLYELLNEPRPQPNARNWRAWAQAMNATIHTVRQAGAHNVAIADGLDVGQVIDGAPLLADPQVAYASHPYALKANGQTSQAWEAKFGAFSQHAPVIITEWLSGGYYCDANTPESTVRFVQYLQQHRIGLEVGAWDWPPGGFGSARWKFPEARVSHFGGLACHQNGYGLGAVVQTWYDTGVPATSPS
ncbi:cellulase family glycosylhydrolase [Amycolatopsis sp. NPDC004079]|uniref:glycoside hydrolase family 5 protein n=1 Tax=Amycolatopsis sp. NPDC004079 TaxID=3154549 RepID=UPI0033B11D87